MLLVNRSAGLAMESARCSRVVLYCSTQASTAAWAAGRSANGTASSSSSRRRLPWNRSILPVVVILPGQGQPVDDAVVADAAAIVETLADPVTDNLSSNPSPPPTCEHSTPPHAAIRMFLEALGVPPQQVPASLEGQTALYHSRLNLTASGC